MTEQEREEFLKQFQEERGTSLAAFCVMGGIFSEGIDLTGEQLIGAVIVGTGLPQVCLERQVLKEYLQLLEKKKKLTMDKLLLLELR